MHHRTFVDQPEQCGPGWHVQNCNDVQRTASPPRHSRLPMPRQLFPKRVQSRLSLAIVTPQVSKDLDEFFCGVHADLLMEYRPTYLEHAHEVMNAEKVIGQRCSGLNNKRTAAWVRTKPVKGPILEAKVAHCDSSIGCFLCFDRPCLNGTTGDDHIGKISELLVPSRIG